MDIPLEAWTWTALWPYAVIIIVVISWAFYHFVAPASWRDWAGAGVVQAFIISLYAEMYGFPLTLYILAGFLPGEIPLLHTSGRLWATLLGLGRVGGMAVTIVGYAIMLAGALLILKGWVRIYFAGDGLVTDGIYGLVRHPQYAGIILVVIGGLVDWPTIPTLILAPVIVVVYFRLATREEARLSQRFGLEYTKYKERVPMFLPHWQDLRLFLSPS